MQSAPKKVRFAPGEMHSATNHTSCNGLCFLVRALCAIAVNLLSPHLDIDIESGNTIGKLVISTLIGN